MPKSFEPRGDTPTLPYDPSASKYCTYWVDYTGKETCEVLLEDNFVTLADFRVMNPSIGADCSGLKSGFSYCVEAYLDAPPASTDEVSSSAKASSTVKVSSTVKASSTVKVSSTATASSTVKVSSTAKASSTVKVSSTVKSSSKAPTSITTKPTPTPTSSPHAPSSTKPANGVQTPLPTQPNIVANCDLFYFVKEGDGCAAISTQFGITLAKFLAWNPSAGSSCGGLWKDAYACVSIIGEQATIPSATPTAPSNGITTPSPTQPNIVKNCDAFHFVKAGTDTCQTLATKYGITLTQFTTWNPSAGGTSCSGLWADAWACVSIIGVSPSPTSPANGVSTPTPIQPGMVTNCKKFDYVKSGEGCDVVITRNKITLANFIKWNTGVGSTCTGMWALSYVCVGV
ncbi:carbohydrate-binding module family 50 protein [Amniculicola lignicola CBS 123094]|uniref:Carbohydrate-binding module family 50 protein n=1 Tax=Amniculicola lignicola CBS 123094 TaxID=1392246 RepID=A0A6A5VVC4_9PLEO|nr:carbohydrate-binding module family 50 protein [Amniculicola lignicola CBS 123094]